MATHREALAERKAAWWTHERLDDVEGAVKCPRCYRMTREGHYNYDGLCDRCCGIILKEFSGHWSASGIKASYAKQRAMTPAEWRRRNHAIDPIAWPLQEGD